MKTYGQYCSPDHTVISFPTVAASLGGAEYVRLGTRYAWIKLPGVRDLVRVVRSSLKEEDMSSFRLADIARQSH